MQIPRIMITGSSSGSGKTAITCAILSALNQKGIHVSACKCGPDYIDPMFHREVLQVPSENLDLFFSTKASLQELFAEHAKDSDIVVTEGVMGYYDGMVLESDTASSYDVSRTLCMPAILVIPCRGMALSVVPAILGMLEFRKDQQIRGIILNRISGMIYPRMKQLIECELQKRGYEIPVVGYVPEDENFQLESRHLGLKLPEHIDSIRQKLQKAGQVIAETVDLEQLLQIAQSAPRMNRISESTETFSDLKNKKCKEAPCCRVRCDEPQGHKEKHDPVRIGVARDAAFSFYYEENLRILRKAGCELVEFSPLTDYKLPGHLQGLLLGGGYPELYASQLSENLSLKNEIQRKIAEGLPTIAECGGFLYLHKSLENMEQTTLPMANIIDGEAFRTNRLGRFGYITLQAETDGVFLRKGEEIKAHEFHYWDSTENGNDCLAVKPDKKRTWNCVHMKENLFAGFPHLYFASNRKFVERFVDACRAWNNE